MDRWTVFFWFLQKQLMRCHVTLLVEMKKQASITEELEQGKFQWKVDENSDQGMLFSVEGSRQWSGTRISFGTYLVLVYVNDLPEGVRSNVSIFTDDAELMPEIHDEKDCETLQEGLDALATWQDRWKMKFNIRK